MWLVKKYSHNNIIFGDVKKNLKKHNLKYKNILLQRIYEDSEILKKKQLNNVVKNQQVDPQTIYLHLRR